MNEAEAVEIATAYVTAAFSTELRLIGVKGERKRKRKQLQETPEWIAFFESPRPPGAVVDPSVVIVVVDVNTKLARFHLTL